MSQAHYGGLLAAALIGPHLPAVPAICIGVGLLFWAMWEHR